jgi:hypothetical protein
MDAPPRAGEDEKMDSKVGGDVEAWCTTCKTMKDHVIVALVDGKPAKVECAGCHKQHVYRANPPGTKSEGTGRTRRTASLAAVSAPVIAEALEARLAGREGDAKAYSPGTRYAVDDIVRHPSFGLGVVVSLPAATKVEIDFRGGRKLLLHDRGSAPVPALERPAPRDDDDKDRRVTDAPPTSPLK